MSLALHIERMVIDETLLDGERVGDVSAVLQRELTRMLAAPGAIDALRGIGTLEALPALHLESASRSRSRLGERIAAAVGEGIGVGPQGKHPAKTGNPHIGRQR